MAADSLSVVEEMSENLSVVEQNSESLFVVVAAAGPQPLDRTRTRTVPRTNVEKATTPYCIAVNLVGSPLIGLIHSK